MSLYWFFIAERLDVIRIHGVRSSAISRPRRNKLAILGSSEPVARHPPQGLSALARVEQRLAPADVP